MLVMISESFSRLVSQCESAVWIQNHSFIESLEKFDFLYQSVGESVSESVERLG